MNQLDKVTAGQRKKHVWHRPQEEPRRVQDEQTILRHCQKDLDPCRL